MVDDGNGLFSATVPAQVNRAIVDFFVKAGEDNDANVRYYPAATNPVATDSQGHDANLLYQVDDTVVDDFVNEGGKDWPADQPIYRIIMPASQLTGLHNNGPGGNRSDESYNATFIVRDPSRGIDVDNGDLAAFNLDDETVSILFREGLFVGGANIDAAHVLENGNIILSTTGNATLGSNLLTFRNGDLIEYDPIEDIATLIFSEDAFGSNEDINAIWVAETGGENSRITELILSTDSRFSVGEGDDLVSYENGDLVRIALGETDIRVAPLETLDPMTVERVFSELLFAGGANIDAVHKLDNGHFLLSTTNGEQLGGLEFGNGAVVEFNPSNSLATIYFDESHFDDGNEDIDALFVDPDNDLLILSTEGNNAGLGADTEIFYNASVRIRGNGSRGSRPRNLRVSLPADHLFNGQSAIPLNVLAPHHQLLGMTIFNEAGLSAEAPTQAVQVRLNAVNGGGLGFPPFGSYVQLQSRDANLAEANYPLDPGGNLFALDDRAGGNSATLTQAPTFDFKDRTGYSSGDYDTGYTKQTNGSIDDWGDLPELARAFSTSLTPNSAGGDTLNFVHKVSQAINVSEWLRHMAVTALVRNNEGGYAQGGRGDDYGLYRGELDTRFELVPHDLDTTFGSATDVVINKGAGAFRGLFRVLEEPAFRAMFAGQLIDLMDNVFNSENLDPIIDELWGVGGTDYVSTGEITRIKTYITARVTFIRGRIATNVEGLGNPVSPNDLSQLPAAYQSLANQQKYLRISEIMYNPRSGLEFVGQNPFGNDQMYSGSDLEFVELLNTGDAPLDLTGVHFKGGILFGFNSGAPISSPIAQTPETILGPGERILVVKDRAAFEAFYGTGHNIAGEFWNGGLSNAGERILLEGRLGEPILDFKFSDGWYDQTDGEGFSLVLREGIDKNTPRSAWGDKGTWRASGFSGGSPGSDVVTPVGSRQEYEPDSIRINELLSHTDASSTGDWVELHNTTDAAIDISGWYLSDSGNNLRKFRIPDNTVIAAHGFVTFDQFGAAGFGLDINDPDFDDKIDAALKTNKPNAFGLSELGDTLRLSSVDPNDIRENINAVHVRDNGNIILSTNGSAVLGANGVSFGNGDLVEYNPQTGMTTLLFSELQFVNVSGGENIDAVSIDPVTGHLILSTAGPATLPTVDDEMNNGLLTFGNGDLVSWNSATKLATLVFSESLFDLELGELVPDENIDAVHALGGGIFIISTGGPSKIGGQVFDDGDLIRVETSDNGTTLVSVSRYFSEALFAIEAPNEVATENIDAVFVVESAPGVVDHLVLSAASSFSLVSPFSAPQLVFDDGDLVEIMPGVSADLGGDTPSFGAGAAVTQLFTEDTFYGRAAGYRETASFGAAEKEVTFGIHEKSPSSSDTTDFVAQVNSSKGSANTLPPGSGPSIGPIVINEIMYHPPGDLTPNDATDDVEFIELFNITGSDVNLWDAANPTNTWTISSAFNFAFPVGTTIPAGGYLLLVSGNPVQFGTDNPDVPDGVEILGYSGSLSNGGESIRLNKPGTPESDGFVPAILVDRVKYDDEAPWPVGVNAADGTGRSLSRFISADYGNDVENWMPSGSKDVTGSGTPGRLNDGFDITPPSVPTDFSSVAFTATRIDLSWEASSDKQSGVDFYTVFRTVGNGDKVEITQTSATTYIDTDDIVGNTDYTYEVSATNTSGIESNPSTPFSVKILVLVSTEVPTVTEVRVELSEALDETSAENIGNYQITGPTVVNVLGAELELVGDRKTVVLTTSAMEEQLTYTLVVADVVATSGNTMALTGQTITVNVPDFTLPLITEVQIAGTAWSQEFLDHLDASGLGAGGFSLSGGNEVIGWSNVNQIIIHFSEHVVIQSGDLTVFGVNNHSYALADFAYDPNAFVATWTLQGSLPADKLLLDLGEGVQDGGDNPVDNNTFSFNVLPGDTDGGDVARSDLVGTMFHLGTETGNGNYDLRFDVDANGRVDVDDLRQVVRRLSTSLPTGTPDSNSEAPVQALDALFERLGGGGSPQPAFAETPLTQTTSTSTNRLPRGKTSPAFARRAGRVAARRAAIEAVDLAIADGDGLADDDGSLLSGRISMRHARRASRRR
jgi:hypothetical protein